MPYVLEGGRGRAPSPTGPTGVAVGAVGAGGGCRRPGGTRLRGERRNGWAGKPTLRNGRRGTAGAMPGYVRRRGQL